jgi:hypothetical protein
MYLTDACRFLISCVIQHYAPVVGWEGWRNRCIMLIMTLDPSWRQTIRLSLPGIEPRSPASQAGTLPKQVSKQLITVLRIRNPKQQQKRGVKKISCHNFLCSHKFHKIANYFSFELLKKKIWANFQRIIELFNQNCQ